MARPAESPHPGLDRELRRGDHDYPDVLLDLADPPDRLFARGPWPLPGVPVAVVGSRAATPYGLRVAERLAGDLAVLGLAVVSGLAHGIDAAAHRGALAAGGVTCAILPGALDRIVPVGHRPLAEQIARRGVLLTECEPGRVAYPSSFLDRNRLIAALARVVVVVEAAERSGALNTAAHARRLGRPVLAVPGDVERPTSRGCHTLLRSGALLCEGVADVRAAIADAVVSGATTAPATASPHELDLPATRAPRAPGADAADDSVSRLLQSLSPHPATVEDCARALGLTVPETLERLLRLEWAGLVRAAHGGRWARSEDRA